MTTLLDYAALSAIIYNDKRGDLNKLLPAPPAGWTEVLSTSNPGFTAGAYRNGNDIVIAFKGSDPLALDENGIADWALANLPSGFGIGSTQLVDAALFYQAIKAANPGANITFTGHSLGGGLASVMSVWFDKQATTFDQAPFLLSAVNPAFTVAVAAKFLLNGIVDSDFASFAVNPLATGLRSSNVQGHYVSGEFLNYFRSHATAIYGSDTPIVIGGGDAVSSIDLHSMNLAAALLMQDKLRNDTVLLPNLLPAIFDEKLYANNLAGSRRDFLTSLLNDQITQGYTNPNGALAKFATDIEKLAQGGLAQNNNELNKALIVAGMEYYYFKDPASTTALFTAEGNGLHFKYSDIGAASYKSLPLLARAIETLLGPAQSFQTGIYGRLIKQDAWHIQSGSGGMTWTATGADNDAAIGGEQADVLDAGAGNDVLLGFGGSDTLTGGAGDDLLMGGAGSDTLNGGDGYDTYIIEGSDTIEDIDGKGVIKDSAGNILSGLIEKRQNGSYVFLADTTVSVVKNADLTLTFSSGNSVTIKNYADGQLGLNVMETPQDESTDQNVTYVVEEYVNPLDSYGHITKRWVEQPTGLIWQLNLSIVVSGDQINKYGGPLATGGDGADRIRGDNNRNWLYGGNGNDVIEGGGGGDTLMGGPGDDRLYADTQVALADAIAAGAGGAGGSLKIWLSGDAGNDIVVGSVNNDVLLGGGGEDVLIGASGDDHIRGDASEGPYAVEWEHTHIMEGDVELHLFEAMDRPFIPLDDSHPTYFYSGWYGPPAAGGVDVIYAGSGNDYVWGQSGDDIVYGEAGNDYLQGDEGNDLLSGGEGDDVLWGDDITPFLANGNDVLIGGAGNDTAVGGLGDDVLQGGSGNDLLYGDIKGKSNVGGNDILEGGEGADELVGGLGDDVLTGGLGVDRLYGDAGNDSLTGDEGDDQLVGGAGNDILMGGTGLDSLFGEDGDDTLRGDENDDILIGGAGNDTLLGGAGVDELQGGDDSDQLEGGEGDDVLAGDAGDDALYGEAGNDELQGGMGNDVLSGEAGNDLLVGGDGDDILTGGLGSDELQGGLGADFLVGGEGVDRLFGEAGNDALYGGAENDMLYGGEGNDLLDGGAGNNQLQGGGGNDTLLGSTGFDALFGQDGDDALYGGANADTLQGGNGQDMLSGGAGIDLLLGEAGNDVIYGEEDNDQLQGGEGNDTLSGGAGIDLLIGEGGDDALYGDEGDDELQAGNGQDTLLGGAGIDLMFGGMGNDILYGEKDNDQLQGGDDNDELYGGEGDDRLYGEAGNDTLDGGAGTDVIYGGLGDNTYLYARGNGADTIIENNTGVGKISKLRFAPGISPAEVEMQRTSEGGDSLALTLKDSNGLATGDRVLLVNYFSGITNTTRVEAIEFANGVTWTLATVQTKLNLPTEGDNIIVGLDYTDFLNGLGGNDVISGKGGDDVLFGGDGNDVLSGGTGSDGIYGDAGNDTLSGGAGTDHLYGGSGSNTYLYGRGDGADTLFENSITSGKISSLKFATDISSAQIKIQRTSEGGDSLVLTLKDSNGLVTNDRVLLTNYFRGTTNATRIDTIEVADATWTLADIQVMFNQATEGDNTLDGLDYAETLDGLGGNDKINGKGGDDLLRGGTGNDELMGSFGNDILEGGDGDDRLQGNSGWTNDAPGASTEIGNDVLYGGRGNDLMSGGYGDDIYLFGRGDGADLMGEGEGGQDILRLGAGILPEHVTLHRTNGAYGSITINDSLVVVIDNSATQIVINGFFKGVGFEVERIEFDNGTGAVWTAADIAARVNLGTPNAMVGTTANNVFVVDHEQDTVTEAANAGIDIVNASRTFMLSANIENLTLTGSLNIDGTGNELDNILRGNVGNNLLDGGPAANPGSDTAYGGLGNDTYRNVVTIIENAGEGIDTWENNWGGTLPDNVENFTLNDGSGIFPSYRVAAIGNNLDNTLISPGYGPQKTILDGRIGADTMIARGWDSAIFYVDNVGDKVIASSSGGSADEVRSYITYSLGSYVENLTLLDAAPISGYGNDLNNVLDASQNSAANFLAGGKGNDTYLLSAGDMVSELANEGIDTVEITSDTANVYDLSQYLNIENLTLSDGVVANATIIGNGQDNILHGNLYSNAMWGGAGNDRVYGGGGGDTLYGDAGDDYIVGGDAAADILYGNAGNDYIGGNGGGDILDGGEGNDILSGDGGSDVYIFNAGHGNDRVRNYDAGIGKQDTIRFGYSPYELSMLRQGDSLSPDNLVFQHVNGQDSVTVEYGYSNPAVKIDRVEFADGTSYSLQDAQAGTSGADNVLGTAINSVIMTGAGDDTLDGAGGNDLLNGGIGNDIYLFGKGGGQDVIYDYDAAPGNIDTVKMASGVLSGEVQLTRLGAASADLVISIVGTTDKVTVKNWFTEGTYHIEKIEFVDGTIWDAATIESRIVIANPPTEGTDILVGTVGDDVINALGGNDTVSGGAGNDILDGGTGADSLFGNSGDDLYGVDNIGDVATELVGEGTDTVQSAITYTLGANLENLTLIGTDAINGTGNELNNILVGNAAANMLDGAAGADTLQGDAGDDTYVVDNVGDVVAENLAEGTDTVQSSITYTLTANLENLTLIGTTAINGTGNELNNLLIGNAAANMLDGAAGADTMQGGAGDDTYVRDNVADAITELANGGIDTVQTSLTYTLAANLENLTLIGTTAINGTGNTLDNMLVGNSAINTLVGGAGNDTLNGGAGADKLTGGTGNDTYLVDNTGDVLTELANEGADTAQSSVTYTLGANIENLTLTGTSAINGTGNTLNNILTGNSAANTLNGGTGADQMSGGIGNDTYVVDNVGDVLTELANEGVDAVQSGVTYTLAANVENLTLTGTAAINATGNTLDNVLVGNSAINTLTGGAGNDTLNGGAGADKLTGGAGDDIYIRDNTSDVVTELANEGIDTVQSNLTYTLVANVENLTLTGTTAINGTGNTLDNVLIGNSAINTLTGGAGNDTLNGMVGADKLTGGAGNDTYVVDNTGDVVTELANEGIDTVQSAITYTLGANVENLTLTGSAAINGTGNALSNVLMGNSAANTLTGGAGNDTYLFGRGAGQDVASNLDTTNTDDKVVFGTTIATDQLWFTRDVNNLRVSIIGTADQITVQNWYSGNDYTVNKFQTSNGSVLLENQVQQLVNAMASMAPPSAGQLTLTPEQQTALNPVLAASWQSAA